MGKAKLNGVKDERPFIFEHFDTSIAALGEPKVDSPIKRIPLFHRDGKLVEKSFVEDTEKVLVYDTMEYLDQLPPNERPLTFELAGPRAKFSSISPRCTAL